MGFLQRISSLILLDKVRSADSIHESLNTESLLFCFPTKKIMTTLVWSCDTNVQEKNS